MSPILGTQMKAASKGSPDLQLGQRQSWICHLNLGKTRHQGVLPAPQ